MIKPICRFRLFSRRLLQQRASARVAHFLIALAIAGCSSVPPPVPTPAPRVAKPDMELACRMLKAAYCAYDVSARSYDPAVEFLRLAMWQTHTTDKPLPLLVMGVEPPLKQRDIWQLNKNK